MGLNLEHDENLKTLLSVVQREGYPIWLDSGSLLGLVRQGSLLEWDKDIDVGFVLGTIDLCSFKVAMEREGFSSAWSSKPSTGGPCIKFEREGGRIVDVQSYHFRQVSGRQILATDWVLSLPTDERLGNSMSLGRFVARRFLQFRDMLVLGNLSCVRPIGLRAIFMRLHGLVGRPFRRLALGYFSSHELLLPLSELEIAPYGRVPVPGNAEGFLAERYGRDWREEKRGLPWHAFLRVPPTANPAK